MLLKTNCFYVTWCTLVSPVIHNLFQQCCQSAICRLFKITLHKYLLVKNLHLPYKRLLFHPYPQRTSSCQWWSTSRRIVCKSPDWILSRVPFEVWPTTNFGFRTSSTPILWPQPLIPQGGPGSGVAVQQVGCIGWASGGWRAGLLLCRNPHDYIWSKLKIEYKYWWVVSC